MVDSAGKADRGRHDMGSYHEDSVRCLCDGLIRHVQQPGIRGVHTYTHSMFSLRDSGEEQARQRQDEIYRQLQQGKREQLLAERRAKGEWTQGEYVRSTLCALAIPSAVLVLMILFIVFARETVELLQILNILPASANATTGFNVTLSNASGFVEGG
jgi:hypothetical protein